MTKKSNKRKIIINGREYESIGSAASAYSISRNTIDYRLSKGWTPEQAVGFEPCPSHAASTPGIKVKVQGHEFNNIKEAAKYYGRSYTHIFNRLKQGCTIEQALGLVKRTDSLQSEYPEISKQWHATKNGTLTADAVTPHSGQKVWWRCSHGHEWKTVINSRTRGYGCPYCAGQKPTAERNFATKYPELVKEWNWEKNGHMKPEDFAPRSQSKVWWKCDKGHSWEAVITNRTRDTRNLCPVCSNRMLGKDNSLAQVCPDIAKDWHPYKNAPLTPNDVVAGGSKKVWWICKHGHEWQAMIISRVKGTGCPKCSLQTSRIEIAVYSELVALFDNITWREKISGYECDIYLPDNKIGIEIDGVYWHSRKPKQELAKSAAFEAEGIQLFRLREYGLPVLSERDVSYKNSENEFHIVSRIVKSLLKYAKLTKAQYAKLNDYLEGKGLANEKLYRKLVANLPAPPPGQSLADKYPEIAKEWAYDLNAPLSPEHFWPQANKKVWWRCKNGHIWKTTPNIRVCQGTNCPNCPRPFIKVTDGRSLAVVNSGLASEWHSEKNGDLRPEDVRPRSNLKVWWQCSKGHEWEAVVSSRAGGSGCPYCYGRFASKTNNLAYKYPELLKEWDQEKNIGLNPSELTPHVGKKVWWRCVKGHSWQATIYNKAKNKSGCPICARNNSRKHSIEEIQAIAKKRGGKCLSNIYTNCRCKIKLRCKEGHIWETRGDSILYTNKWCPVCAKK